MNSDDLKAGAHSVNVELEKGSDYLSKAGMNSGYGWIVYLTFLVVGFLLGKFL